MAERIRPLQEDGSAGGCQTVGVSVGLDEDMIGAAVRAATGAGREVSFPRSRRMAVEIAGVPGGREIQGAGGGHLVYRFRALRQAGDCRDGPGGIG